MSDDKWTLDEKEFSELFRAFIDSPPEGTPSVIIEAFERMKDGYDMMVSPRLFQEVVEQSSVAISITDDEANIIYANPQFAKVTGYTIDEVIGKNESTFSAKSTPAIVYDTMWARLGQLKSWSGILVNQRKNGEHYLSELTVAPVVSLHGRITHYLGMHRDVTEFHTLQQQVLNQKTLIESLIDAAPVMLALLDESGHVVLDNMAYKTLKSDMRGVEPAELFMSELPENMTGTVEPNWVKGKNINLYDIRFDPGGGKNARWFSFSGTWFQENQMSAHQFFNPVKQTYLLLIITETTDQKRDQEQVRVNALRALMAEYELVQGMRETIASVVYSLERPINLIRSAVTMLERRKNNGDENLALIEVLRQTINEGQKTLQTFQDSMPGNAIKELELVNINQILRDVLGLSTERLLTYGIVVEWDPQPLLPNIYGYANQLRSMFRELIDNAIDAMQISRSNLRELHIHTCATSHGVVITIEDTGPGIPESLRLKIFEPFFTTKRSVESRTALRGTPSGMGLSMVQEIVNEHTGTIRIDPDYVQGCRFIIQIPIGE